MKNLDPVKFPQGLLVPCGQCMNCRLQKREEWCTRLLHESLFWDSCMFLTLTYSDDHLPENESIKKRDLQLFFKRLRKNMPGRKLKYFCAGEYGEQSGRPHYHCIIFGLDFLNPDDVEIVKRSWTLCDWNSLGRKPFGDITPQSVRYVCSYIEKTITGRLEEYAYPEGVDKPFHIVSKGLGKEYAIQNKDVLEQTGRVKVSGYSRSIPRYYSDVAGFSRDELQQYAEEKERETMESLTGASVSRDEFYLIGEVSDVLRVERTINESNKQHDLNIKARASMRLRGRHKGM